MSPGSFSNYLDMPTRVPLRVWHVVRLVGLVVLVTVAVGLTVDPSDFLAVFWGMLVPVLPVVLIVAPGLWRNVCPVSGVNQASRNLGITTQHEPPKWLADNGYRISIVAFVGIALSRKTLFNHNGIAVTVLLGAVLALSTLGGRLFKGKSGWCSSLCPMLPVEGLYGQAPFVGVPNSHCRPCLSCTSNCYDFNPRQAYLAHMYGPDAEFRRPRRLFAGAFPGFVLAFYVVPDAGRLDVLEVYGRCLLWIAASIALFMVFDAFGKFAANTLPVVFGGAAFSLFYWFGIERVETAFHKVLSVDVHWIVWPVRIVMIGVAAAWVVRGLRLQRRFVDQVADGTLVEITFGRSRIQEPPDEAAPDEGTSGAGIVEIDFEGHRVTTPAGVSLLDAALAANLPIEIGCRMGVCGADPVAITRGFDHLSPIRKDEANTLERLGLGGHNRMACVARAKGACSVSFTPDRTTRPAALSRTFTPDPSITKVVVIGNGIAGVTVGDFLRRNHPDCEIDIIGLEPHPLYNRMGISRLIHGRSALQSLYLLPNDWYERNNVNLWLNTRAVEVDRVARVVRLGTGEVLPYDRVVLATGGVATQPRITGFGVPGCFVLRHANDAMQIRAYVQEQEQRRAIVAGGGLLGLEAAHAMLELGMTVSIFERSSRLLRKSLDPLGSDLLRSYFESLGISVFVDTEIERVEGDGRLETAVSADGSRHDAEVLLVATGVTPNVDLAARAGLVRARGVLVDDHLRTSDPDIYAVGDVAEFNGRMWGLWPVAVAQAQVAAVNVAGGERTYTDEVPITLLKGVGLDVLSFGRVEPRDGDEVIAERGAGNTYRKIILQDGRIVGGVFLGNRDDAQHALDIYESARVLDATELASLRAGDWSPLGAATVGAHS